MKTTEHGRRAAEKSNRKKSKFLGMSISTAKSKLVRLLLFSFAEELGRNTCYRCKQTIETSEDFTIDHKEPWLHNDLDLFWDLENIAFSHHGCNSSAARRPTKITRPNGTSWCSRCQSLLDKEEFSKNCGDPHGLSWICKKCTRNYRRSRK